MLILKIASREQYEVTLIRQHTIWAKLNEETELTLDQYVKREKLLTSSKFGERFLAWVLVPEDEPETLNFYASCETYRRSVWIKQKESLEPFTAVSYSIAGVLVPAELRLQGYASEMLKLLHTQLALPSIEFNLPTPLKESRESSIISSENGGSNGSPADSLLSDSKSDKQLSIKLEVETTRKNHLKPIGMDENKIQPASSTGGRDAVLSFLFSDVGEIYSQIGNGWHVRNSGSTIWSTSSLPSSSFESTSLSDNCELNEDFTAVASVNIGTEIDSKGLEHLVVEDTMEMWSFLLSSCSKTLTIIIEPTFENYQWAILRSNFYAKILNRIIPNHYGLKIDCRNFIIFLPDYPNETLKVLRLSCSEPDKYSRTLLQSLFKAAKKMKLEKIEGWNISKEILNELNLEERGESSVLRKDSLSSLSWYGGRDGNQGKNVDWEFNEAYAWC